MGKSADLKNNIKVLPAFIPQALSATTDITGLTIDTLGYESVTFVLFTDAVAATSLAAQLLIEDGAAANLSDAAAVDDAFLIGVESDTAITQASDSVALKIAYTGSKRYIRANLDITTNNGTDVVAGVCILGNPKQAPVA